MSLAQQLDIPTAPSDGYVSETAYLAAEKAADERHEYINGKIYAMAGSSKRHNRIAMNCAMHLGMAARQSPCNVYASDVKVRVQKRNSYYYPDVVVGCAEDDNDDDYYLEKPCLIVEVSSNSTVRKDYLEKSLAYQTIASLQAYLIVAQDKPLVDMLVRDESGAWELQQFDQLTDSIHLPCLDLSLTLAMLYEGLENPTTNASDASQT